MNDGSHEVRPPARFVDGRKTGCRRIIISALLITSGLILAATISREAMARRGKGVLDPARNRPFIFYGRVVDGGNAPVPEAAIHLIVEGQLLDGAEGDGGRVRRVHHDVVSSEEGRFQVGPAEGWRICVGSIEAPGYRFDPTLQPSRCFYPVTHPSMLKSPVYFRRDERFPVVLILSREP